MNDIPDIENIPNEFVRLGVRAAFTAIISNTWQMHQIRATEILATEGAIADLTADLATYLDD